ncbi:MAG: hypothetical protein HXS47_02250 [Theionarchaea archaeon]|nr:hypothetical protein [Theionarchaea archaeon]
MKLSQILGKSVDIITEQPQMLLPYGAPFVLSLIAMWIRITNMLGWGITRLNPLGRSPLKFFTYFVASIRALRIIDWVMWILILSVLAICVALTIVMSDAALKGRKMSVGAAFETITPLLPLFVIAFLISWLLKFIGMFFFWVGVLVPAVLLIFVGQALLLDGKDLFDSFSKSYDTARENIMDVLALLFIFLVILAVVRLVPLVGMAVALILLCYSAVTFTVLYRSKKPPQRVRPKKAKPAPTA